MTASVESGERADVRITDEPFFMGYEGPGTVPSLRRNEVSAEIEESE